jgi:hypothetical protein
VITHYLGAFIMKVQSFHDRNKVMEQINGSSFITIIHQVATGLSGIHAEIMTFISRHWEIFETHPSLEEDGSDSRDVSPLQDRNTP